MKTLGRKSYYVRFTDDHSCKTHLELLSHKSDVFNAYKVYEAKLKCKNRSISKLYDLIKEGSNLPMPLITILCKLVPFAIL